MPNADQVKKEKLYNVLLGLNTLEFGAFVRFSNLENISLSELDNINVTALYEHVCIEIIVFAFGGMQFLLNSIIFFYISKYR